MIARLGAEVTHTPKSSVCWSSRQSSSRFLTLHQYRYARLLLRLEFTGVAALADIARRWRRTPDARDLRSRHHAGGSPPDGTTPASAVWAKAMRAVASANSVDLRPRALDSDPAPSVMLAPTWPMNKMDSLSGCYLLGEPSDRKLIGVAASIAGKPFDSNARAHTDLLGVGQRNRLQLRPPPRPHN